jgi:hypothetical protein
MVNIVIETREPQENEFFYSSTARFNEHNTRELFEYLEQITNLKFEWIPDEQLSGRNFSESSGLRIINKEEVF